MVTHEKRRNITGVNSSVIYFIITIVISFPVRNENI